MENIKNLKNKQCTMEYEVNIKDCLACSGCITDDEVESLNTLNKIENIDSEKKMTFLITPFSKVNLYNFYKKRVHHSDNDPGTTGDSDFPSVLNSNPEEQNIDCNTANFMTYDEFCRCLTEFLHKKFNIFKIFDTSYCNAFIYDKIYGELKDTNLIISDCPSVVQYIEKQAPHLIKFLSRTNTSQHYLSQLVFEGVVISVAQCYDKAVENIKCNSKISYNLSTLDFFRLLEKYGFAPYKTSYELHKWEETQNNFGSTCGGALEYVMQRKYGTRDVKNYLNIEFGGFCDSDVFLDKITEVKKNGDGRRGTTLAHTKDIIKNINPTYNSIKNMKQLEKSLGKEKIHNNINKKIIDAGFFGVKINILEKNTGYYIYQVCEGDNNSIKTKNTKEKGSSTKDLSEKYVRISGIENILNFFKETKLKGFGYKLAEIYVCPGGCINGISQLDVDPSYSFFDYISSGKKYVYSFELADLNIKEREFSAQTKKGVKFKVEW